MQVDFERDSSLSGLIMRRNRRAPGVVSCIFALKEINIRDAVEGKAEILVFALIVPNAEAMFVEPSERSYRNAASSKIWATSNPAMRNRKHSTLRRQEGTWCKLLPEDQGSPRPTMMATRVLVKMPR